MKNSSIALILTVLLVSASSMLAQEPVELGTDAELSSQISGGEEHSYRLKLKKNSFALIKVDQKGIDLMIDAHGPGGAKIGEFDSPNGSNGPEYVQIEASEAGSYGLKVRPLNGSGSGSYGIRVLKVQKLATTNEGRVDQIFAQWDLPSSPGVSVAVVKDGKIVLKKGYGLANLEYGVKNSPSTVFHIASVSKQFTCFAVLLLEADGKLSMDDDVRKYIPELHDFGKKITLRHLANHTSGLRDQWTLLAMAGWRLDDVITKDHIMKLVARQKDLNFDPGAEYLYSNTGYTLLAEVVARVSGKSFAEFTEERIFRPLEMKNTLFYDDHEKIVRNRAYSYFPRGDGYQKLVLSYANVGATSLFTTAEDLALWALNFESPKVGDKQIVEKMRERAVLNDGNEINYALGQLVGTYKGVEMINHSGGDAGYRSFLARFPAERLAVLVLSNDGAFSSGSNALKVADLYLNVKEPVAAPAEAKAEETEGNAFQVPMERLNAYTGEWEVQPGVVVTLKRSGGVLMSELNGQQFKVVPVSLTKFIVEGVGFELEFQEGPDGKFDKFLLNQAGQTVTVSRIAAFDPDEAGLQEYTGRFYSEELDTAYEFEVKEGKLTAVHQRHPDIVFAPVKKDEFNGNAWFYSRVVFERDPAGKISGLKVTSGRVRNLKFAKMSLR